MSELGKLAGINSYSNEVPLGQHREAVGGMWEEIGKLQFEFLKARGLEPAHKLLDMGCGSLRGGLWFIDYLDRGGYHGLDINESLIDAGRQELQLSQLEEKGARLLVDDSFRASRFHVQFDFAISISVFTHLPMDFIGRCLLEVKRSLHAEGRYFASYFEAPTSVFVESLYHPQGGIVSQYDKDPFHQSFNELSWLASQVGLKANRIGSWSHPRNQLMAEFSHADE